MSDREEQLKAVIRQMLRPLRDIPLDIIIEAITGQYTIWPYDGHARKCLEAIASHALAAINAHGIVSNRANEVGNKCEPFVRRAIMAEGTIIDARNLSCDVKFEFNSDNRRLYGTPEMIVARIDA